MITHDTLTADTARLEHAVEQALSSARRLGATEAAVAIHKQMGLTVSTRNGEIENVESNQDGALGINVYWLGAKGSASTHDLSPSAITAAVEAALTIAKQTSIDPAGGLPDKSWLAWDAPDLGLFAPLSLDPAEATALAQRCEHAALADGRIKQSEGATVTSQLAIQAYGNSHDFLASYASTSHALNCSLIAEQQGAMQRDYSYSCARALADVLSPEAVAADAVARTLARLGARPVPTAQVPVLLAPSVASSFLGHLASAISGGNVYRRSTFLLEDYQQLIMPTWLSIDENPHIVGALGSAPFDDDGVATQPRAIIADGRLMTWLLSTYSARKLHMPSTGHAGGIYNWRVSTTGQTQAELLHLMGTGFMVTELMGQGVNTVTGDYSRGASGFWVENGVIQYPVEGVTLAGNLKTLFQGIQAIGRDVDPRRTIQTGAMLIEGFTLAGE